MPSSSPLSSNSHPTTVQSLGSGSSGNGFLITHHNTVILLDCGVGIRSLQRGLRERSRTLDGLDAIVVTHEHSDHVRTLSSFVGRDVPIVSTVGTRRRANIPPPQWEAISFARPLEIGEVTVWAIGVSHDAAEPCGYLLETPTSSVSIFTDLGCWNDAVAEAAGASDLVVLESNHDEVMLRRGPYPMHLKRRVASDVGHLSNAACAMALAEVLQGGATEPEIWLAHLSETNNLPELAAATTVEALATRDVVVPVTALPRRAPGPVWTGPLEPIGSAWSPTPPPVPVPQHTQLGFDALIG